MRLRHLVVSGIIGILYLGILFGQDAPSQVRLAFGDDPSTSVRIMWQTREATETVVEYGETPSLGQVAYGHLVTYSLQTGVLHEVTLTGLHPGALCYYRVGNPNAGFSAVYTFRTAPQRPTAFTFTASGDDGTSTAARQNIQNVLMHNPAFHLHLGDLSYANGVQSIWDTYLNQIEPLTSRIPMMITLGNHEWEDEVGIGYEAVLARFAMPGENNYNVNYVFDYGNVRFIAFNSDWYERSSASRTAMRQWLGTVLNDTRANPCIRWVIVFQHHPLFGSEARRGYNTLLINALQPLFDQYKVDLVLQGHDHFYERTYPLRNSTPVSNNLDTYLQGEGTLYITCSLLSFHSVEAAKMRLIACWLGLGLLLALKWGQASGEPLIIRSSTWYCPVVNQRDIYFAVYNRTGEKIYAFIINFTEMDGLPYNDALILGVSDYDNEHDPDFDIDDDMNGTIEDPEEANQRATWNPLSFNDNTDYSPETIIRLSTILGDTLNDPNRTPMDSLLDGNTDPLDIGIHLNSVPLRAGCLIWVPQDRHLNVMAYRMGCGFSSQSMYAVRLAPEIVWRAPMAGIAFNDLNSTGQTLTHLYLKGTGFAIQSVVQKNADGDLITGGTYDAQTGYFELPAPIPPDSKFFLVVIPNVFWGSSPMVVRAALWPIPEGDVDMSGCVGDEDLLGVLFAMGNTCLDSPCPEDLDGNGIVDDNDLLTVLFHFGEGCE